MGVIKSIKIKTEYVKVWRKKVQKKAGQTEALAETRTDITIRYNTSRLGIAYIAYTAF